MKVLERLFGTYSTGELRELGKTADRIMVRRKELYALSDAGLKAKTAELKNLLVQGKTLEEILPEAFAVVSEAARRVLGIEPYRVQLMGGIVLQQGRIAQMRTGEGKTLVAVLPAYLEALSGRSVHVVTVNDYLARRDAEQMGEIHRFLGLRVGLIQHDMTREARREAYACDITYVTNSELGFDYLRDNMQTVRSGQVLRGLHYAIIDEVDSILIDEARTPLILSSQGENHPMLYQLCNELAMQMKRGIDRREMTTQDAIQGIVPEETGDYTVDEKHQTVTLTQEGFVGVEEFFRVKNLADPENAELHHAMLQALTAKELKKRDRDYIVRGDEVLIVDEFTGRVLPGRKFSEGLHQAIEAKEKVSVKEETQTLASITYQNFFNLYEKKAGMTGTAQTEETEFREIYSMDVVVIPTNRPVVRKDLPDLVYRTRQEKYAAILQDVCGTHKKGQPVLIGTVSIEDSEELDKLLCDAGIPHQVLNAKNHEKEAEVISHAGEYGAVTIATNMAGRGTDIRLDERARQAGGLKVIGTERHESRRIDDQLRGRSGRQGDPGESRFYLSLEDSLLRLFGSDKLGEMFAKWGLKNGEAMSHGALTQAVEKAQKDVESYYYGMRKNLQEYDRTLSEQREIFYHEREKILNTADMENTVSRMITEIIDYYMEQYVQKADQVERWNFQKLDDALRNLMPAMCPIHKERFGEIDKEAVTQELKKEALALCRAKEEEFPNREEADRMERQVLLSYMDVEWRMHMEEMEVLRLGIGLQAYGQKDPVLEYRLQGYELFEQMIRNIREKMIYFLFHLEITYVVDGEPA